VDDDEEEDTGEGDLHVEADDDEKLAESFSELLFELDEEERRGPQLSPNETLLSHCLIEKRN